MQFNSIRLGWPSGDPPDSSEGKNQALLHEVDVSLDGSEEYQLVDVSATATPIQTATASTTATPIPAMATPIVPLDFKVMTAGMQKTFAASFLKIKT